MPVAPKFFTLRVVLPLEFDTLTETEVLAVVPRVSVARAVSVCAALEREVVSRLKDQLVVPEAREKVPPSTRTWTELTPRGSEATPETVIVPETVAPLVGEEMATVGGRATPVPDNAMMAGELVALLATWTPPVRLPAPVGANVTFRVTD